MSDTQGGHSPLSQFEVKPLIQLPEIAGYDISFTNASLFMVLAVALITFVFGFGTRQRALVPGRFQNIAELGYEMVANIVKENIGRDGRPYFPLIFSLFMFVMFCNLLGMAPYSFTVTSHIAVTFCLAILIFFGVTILAIVKHGSKFLGYFLPDGTPWWMAPMIYIIELFSYLSRPVSLSLRLSVNMMAGHTMLKVLAGFVIMMGIWGVFPLLFISVMIGFEIFVAILQAYIFTVLTCVYLNDALHLH